MENFPTIIRPIMQSNLSSGRTAPAFNAAAIVNVFIVEPGS